MIGLGNWTVVVTDEILLTRLSVHGFTSASSSSAFLLGVVHDDATAVDWNAATATETDAARLRPLDGGVAVELQILDRACGGCCRRQPAGCRSFVVLRVRSAFLKVKGTDMFWGYMQESTKSQSAAYLLVLVPGLRLLLLLRLPSLTGPRQRQPLLVRHQWHCLFLMERETQCEINGYGESLQIC